MALLRSLSLLQIACKRSAHRREVRRDLAHQKLLDLRPERRREELGDSANALHVDRDLSLNLEAGAPPLKLDEVVRALAGHGFGKRVSLDPPLAAPIVPQPASHIESPSEMNTT